MTKNQLKQFNNMRSVLKKIASAYQTTAQLRKSSKGQYGLDYMEALEMAYENIQTEAANAARGVKYIPNKDDLKKILGKVSTPNQ